MASIKSRKALYKGKLLRLYLRRVRLPSGVEIDLEVIEHPGAALIIPFLNAHSIVMLRQYRSAVGGYLYELPAGTRDTTETFLACAHREIIEETGYRAGAFRKLGFIYPVPGYSTEKIVIYKALRLQRGAQRHEDDEVITTRVIDKQEARRLFKRGRIVDAKTICALAFCGWL